MSMKKTRVPGTRVRKADDHDRGCVLIGDTDDPVVLVHYRRERVVSWDSGFEFVTSSAPDPEDISDDDIKLLCLHCLKLRHPEVERGLLLARAYGSSWWSDEEGSWMAEDEDGNEVLFASGDEPDDAGQEGRP